MSLDQTKSDLSPKIDEQDPAKMKSKLDDKMKLDDTMKFDDKMKLDDKMKQVDEKINPHDLPADKQNTTALASKVNDKLASKVNHKISEKISAKVQEKMVAKMGSQKLAAKIPQDKLDKLEDKIQDKLEDKLEGKIAKEMKSAKKDKGILDDDAWDPEEMVDVKSKVKQKFEKGEKEKGKALKDKVIKSDEKPASKKRKPMSALEKRKRVYVARESLNNHIHKVLKSVHPDIGLRFFEEIRKRGETEAMSALEKRKRVYVARESLNNHIHKALKSVHPDTSLSSKAITIMDSFCHDVFDRLVSEALKLMRINGKKTLGFHEIQSACKLVLPGELSKHAVQDGAKAVTNYLTAKMAADAVKRNSGGGDDVDSDGEGGDDTGDVDMDEMDLGGLGGIAGGLDRGALAKALALDEAEAEEAEDAEGDETPGGEGTAVGGGDDDMEL